jgi:hypothetical protein
VIDVALRHGFVSTGRFSTTGMKPAEKICRKRLEGSGPTGRFFLKKTT